jgi:hypothetical protein
VLILLHDEMVQAAFQIGAEARLGGVEAGQDLLLDERGEEALHQIFGLFVGALPLDAHVFVRRLPIHLDDRLERFAGQSSGTRGAHDERVPRCGKWAVRTAHGGIGIVRHDRGQPVTDGSICMQPKIWPSRSL